MRTRLVRALHVATGACAVLGLVALAAPERVGTAAGWATVGVLVAAPLVRVGWLAVHWRRRGDARHARWGLVVLVLVLAGALVAGLGANLG